jgi:NADH-quinone oxidoreductase subunit G
MPDLIIDGRPVSVAKGVTVIEAAEQAGIMIPRFCWHKALGAAGACRMCAVMFIEGPVKGLEMSCMTLAADGMVVETGHPQAVAFRRHIVELLMVNHPHDCPVCDEGGQCLLQDETISGGHSLRRFPGRKRTYADQDLGPFIQHEMNRCIHCYRCARFYQEFCGYRDFGPMQNANRVYFGRFEDGPLENPFSGNLADLCPTGTLTDKPGRFVARRFDCQRAPSVCLHCSLGCNVTVLSRYRRVARIEARENPAVNGSFLCDRGRYSFGYDSAPDRPRTARIGGRAVPAGEAVAAAAKLLASVATRHGRQAVAIVGGQRSTMETQAAVIALAQAAGWSPPAFFASPKARDDVRNALTALSPDRAVSLAGIERADAVLVVGVSPLFDAPMLALSLRQAARAGAKVFVADPRPVALPLPFTPLPLAPRHLPAVLAVAGAGTGAAGLVQQHFPLVPELWPALEALAQTLAAAKRPALVFAPALARHLPADARFGLFPVLAAAATAGAALLSPPDAPGLDALAAGLAAGRIKALVVVEADLSAAAPALAAGLGSLEGLVALDCLATPTLAAAQIVLPTATLFETGGLLAASDGRLQRADPVKAPGLSVLDDGAGSHPPRAYDRELPGTDPAPAAFWCDQLARALGLQPTGDALAAALAADPLLAGFAAHTPSGEGWRPAFPGTLPTPPPTAFPPSAEDGLAVVFEHPLFAADACGRHSPLVRDRAGQAVVRLNPDDAAAFGLEHGAAVAVACGDRLVPATLSLTAEVARGVAVFPRLPQFAALSPTLGPCGLRRRETP